MRNKKGFTLAELMVVVAIIGVLVAVSVPIFNSQLEKSREATDLANVRSAYAQVMTEAVTNDTPNSISVNLKQKKDGCRQNFRSRLAALHIMVQRQLIGLERQKLVEAVLFHMTKQKGLYITGMEPTLEIFPQS